MIDAFLRGVIFEAVREAIGTELPRALATAPAADPSTVRTDEIAVSAARAGELTGYSAETILAHVGAGRLKASKPAGSKEWRILTEDLRRWVSGGGAANREMTKHDTKAEAARVVSLLPATARGG